MALTSVRALLNDIRTDTMTTLDTVVDSILVDTGTTIPGTLGTPAGADLATDIAAVKTDTAAVLVDTGTTLPATLGTPAGADLATDIAAVKTDTAAVLVDTGTTIPASLWQDFNVQITAAANAGDTAVADVADGDVWILGITVRSNGATTADLTSAAISAGGAAGTATVVTGLDAATAVKASLDADGEFLAMTGQPFKLEAADKIRVDLQGTGATAVDLDVDILYINLGGTVTTGT